MDAIATWSKEVYESSVSSHCWNCTPYDQGWDSCAELRTDEVLRRLVVLENTLSPIPPWARDTVERRFSQQAVLELYAQLVELLDGRVTAGGRPEYDGKGPNDLEP